MGAVRARGGPSPSRGLVLGAIHDCGSDALGATQYYRFFADGEVISVTSTGTPEQVAEWFVAGYEDSGTYTVDGDRIRGSTTWEDVTVEFDGTVADDGTVTMTTTSTNGHVSEVTCTPVGDQP